MVDNFNISQKYNLWDYIFIIWFITDSCFGHTPVSMIGQLLFVIYSFVRCINLRILKGSYLFLLYGAFIYFCWYNIISGHAISEPTARTMLRVVIRNFIFIVFLFQYLKNTDLEKLKFVFLYICAVSSFIILLLNYQTTGTFQIRDVEGSINGNLQAINNAIAIGWFYCLRSRKLSMKYIVICGFLFLFCILAGTRKAMIAMVMIIVLYTMLCKPQKIVLNVFKIAVIVAFVLFLLLKVDFIYDMIGNRFEGLLGFINGKNEVDASTETRGRFIELGFAYFLMEPIYGHGIDCFREIKGAFDTYSHNNYIELLFGIGIPGTIAYYMLYVIPLAKGIRNYITKRTNYVIMGAVIILVCLFSDYGLVSYFDRNTYFRIFLCYFFVSSVKSRVLKNG